MRLSNTQFIHSLFIHLLRNDYFRKCKIYFRWRCTGIECTMSKDLCKNDTFTINLNQKYVFFNYTETLRSEHA